MAGMADVERVQQWVLNTAQLMADYPDAIRVEVLEVGERIVLRLHVHRSDVGKMIGRQGRTGRSLRTIGSAITQVSGKWFTLDIVETDKSGAMSETR